MNMVVNTNILYLQNFLVSPGLSEMKFCLAETSLRERSFMEEMSLYMGANIQVVATGPLLISCSPKDKL